MKCRVILAASALLLSMQGCRIVQTAGFGGSIVSESGNHDCPEGQTCVVDIPDGEPFSETLTATPRNGYAFAGWLGTEPFLCAGDDPSCAVDFSASATAYNVGVRIAAEFYHQPELVDAGAIAVEYGLWSTQVEFDPIGLIFAEDFDADGDDDVLIAAATYPGEEFAGVRNGVVLINDGGYTFTVAKGDRPSSVHPREVLMADFNGDGRNDFFIADHGYDVPPFPGSDNQLLLWNDGGYVDASDRLPDDPTGFTHNGGVGDIDGDGDVDILVANHGGEFMGGGPYLLMNDGAANFTASASNLPERVATDRDYRTWAAQIADLDGDGHQDLLMGGDTATGESFIYWGAEGGEFHDRNVTVLEPPAFFFGPEGGHFPISTATRDLDRDGLMDVILGSYNGGPDFDRAIQILINADNRKFNDETERRLGASAWSATEPWHSEHRFLDFNGDGTTDIVPQGYSHEPNNILAWLNDGTGHYVALKSAMFNDAEALYRFGQGVKIREGSQFKSVEFFGDGKTLNTNAGLVVTNAVITFPD